MAEPGARGGLLQTAKNYLVKRGPDSLGTRVALAAHGRLHGFSIRSSGKTLRIRRGHQEMVLSHSQYVQVPLMMESFELFFRTMCPRMDGGVETLDFSAPALHRYKSSGAAFHFPSVPEDEVMDAYTHWYTPKPGDIVWDAGAHAGASTYSFSKAVGPGGKVYAFEPDESNYEYLVKNIAMHDLTNVVAVKKGLDGKTGTASFLMDGTMSAGIQDYVLYSDGKTQTIQTVSIPDACEEFGCCPDYIKMDIEGAEVASLEGAAEFLKTHPIHFAIESCHPRPGDGELTYRSLDRFFPTVGYRVASSDQFGQMFTWATAAGSE